MSGTPSDAPGFPIPSSLQELESSPYHLLPYPADFDDADESARSASFASLIRLLEGGNRTLASAGMGLFDEEDGEGGYDAWNDTARMQALYTLVRKSESLAPAARGRLVGALCDAVNGLSDALASTGGEPTEVEGGQSQAAGSSYVVPQSFRDALACHIYMLFTLMFLAESKEKLGKSLGNPAPTGRGKAKKGKDDKGEDVAARRQQCAAAMSHCAATMAACRSRLWRRGVPDESVVGLPCRIAYQMLESASGGAAARKAAGGDRALEILAATVDGAPCLLGTVVAALVDLLHTYDHLAPLVAELCTMVKESPTNVLATELLREIGRLDTSTYSDTAAGGKASGIKHVAPFLSALAAVRPRVVVANLSLLLPHLDCEAYVLRSAIINSIGAILVREDVSLMEAKDDTEEGDEEDSGKEQRHLMNVAKTRASLFDILCERAQADVTSFTRGAALKVLNDLTERQSLPLDRLMPVTAIAIDRLQDKTVMVRRCAMQLLTTLLENNPFMGILDPEIYRSKVRELEAYLKANVPEEILQARDAALAEARKGTDTGVEEVAEEEVGEAKEAGGEDDLEEGGEKEIGEDEEDDEEEKEAEEGGDEEKDAEEEMPVGDAEVEMEKNVEEIEAAALAAAIADAEAKQEAHEALSDAESDFLAKVRGLRFASSALAFVEAFEDADDAFRMMLGSSNSSDVTEALRFLVKAKHFGLPCAVSGMKRALALMWSNEPSVQEEVLKAFVEVFVSEPGTQGKELLPENQIAQNFLDLTGEATVSELASIEEALGRLVKKEMIPPDVFSILWTMASQAEGKPRASAMAVISMAASADPKIVDSAYRLQNLYDAGLGDHVEENRDWATARSAALALQRVRRAKVDPSSAKYIILDLIAERLVSVARGDWCDDEDVEDTNAWFAAAEQAINAIFAISPAPERVSMEILLGHQAGIFGSDGEPSNSAAHSLRLSRFFFVLGHIALKLLIYTEVLSSSVRRANAAKTVKKQEQSATSGQNKEKEDRDAGSKEGSDEEEDDAIEAELGIAAQAEAETERRVAEISENEIVGRGMIGLFMPMLLRVVANEDGTFSSPVLMRSATLALCKCMCISKSFCEKHLPLIFSVLAKAPNDDQDLRANIVIALGDLAFRFPNEVEPYTPKLYACLRDKSTRVRRHTLMVLTHLILNDMVKVKGNVCEIALCLQDEEPRIRDMARLLFHELSKRTNSPIYNLLPDIVSQLSQLNLKQEVFREIMLFLLSFIKKDRQNEMLMEKLIQRFPKCTSINQKADLAYCIAQLKVNDKCVKCLNDNFKLYKDALFDEDVLRNFVTVLAKAKKIAKPETKDAVEELENKLNEHAAAGLENVKASKKAARAKKRAAKRVAKKKEWEESDEEEELEEAEASDPEPDEFEFDEENRPENRNPTPKVADGATKGRGGRSTRTRRGRGVLS